MQEPGPRQSVAAVTRKSLQLTENANKETMRGLVQLVTSLFEQRRFKKGDMLARQGTPATTMFYLQEGLCEIVHDLHSGDADEDFVEEQVSEVGAAVCCGVPLLCLVASAQRVCQRDCMPSARSR